MFWLQVFDLHYADGSHLRGFNGVDQVWVSAMEQCSEDGLKKALLRVLHAPTTWELAQLCKSSIPIQTWIGMHSVAVLRVVDNNAAMA